jgi:1-phosphatidylinositol-4-phosphate 5-kinase
MNELSDTLSVLNLEAWNATDTGVLSYIKTPIQQTFFNNNSDLIGKALRQAIIYFVNTLNDIDRESCILGTEFRSTRTHNYQIPSPTDDKTSESTLIEITTYAPIAFEYMRTILGITRNDFQSSFNDGELINFSNTGKSGSQMYKTQDDVYIIKTLRDHEAKLLIQSLSGLYLRYSHTLSLMTRYVGLYSVSMRSLLPSEIFCVVMLNNLPSIIDIHEIYDLKGSSVGRYSSIDLPLKRLKALKDLDFESFYPRGIRIPNEIYRRLKITIENDVYELRKMMITDFSLMLGIYQLDEYSQDEENTKEILKTNPKPQLGISSLFAATNIDRTAIQSNNNLDQIDEKINFSKTKLINKFIMKPLHLIGSPQEDTFNDNSMASSLLGIPGLTHDGRRVLLYPAFIDCLQTFDNFKRMQYTIQNIRDSKRGSEYR